MSITDELRNYTEEQIKWLDMTKVHYRKLFAIADRIDAEHERVCYDYQREFEDWKFVHDTEFVELPKDADGLSIHIGDKVTLHGRHVYEVDAIFFYKNNVSVSYEGESGRGCDSASNVHHYREPTVEDMLWELLGKIAPSMEDKEAVPIVKAYAEKLRLADDGKEQQ